MARRILTRNLIFLRATIEARHVLNELEKKRNLIDKEIAKIISKHPDLWVLLEEIPYCTS